MVLTGFGEGNQQLRVNGLTWGRDNWVYGANGRSGGAVRRPSDPPEKAVSIARNDFRFRPATGEVEAVAGFSQFGLPRDDRGDRFPSWNTIPIRHVVIEERALSRNPYLAESSSVASILDPSDGGRVFAISPTQATFNRESTAYFNATCGPTIYRGDALGESYRGNAFFCESLTNLVQRRVLEPAGPTFLARRGEPGRGVPGVDRPRLPARQRDDRARRRPLRGRLLSGDGRASPVRPRGRPQDRRFSTLERTGADLADRAEGRTRRSLAGEHPAPGQGRHPGPGRPPRPRQRLVARHRPAPARRAAGQGRGPGADRRAAHFEGPAGPPARPLDARRPRRPG